MVRMAFVVATGVAQSGDRELLGFDSGLSEDAAFLRDLVARGLRGVQLVISDAHTGPQAAIRQVLQGASWQRCRVHFMRNLLVHVPKQAQTMVSALVRTIFAQSDPAKARTEWGHVVDRLDERFPKAAARLVDAEGDILADMGFPHEHWKQMASTNPLERLNREIGRRAEWWASFRIVPQPNVDGQTGSRRARRKRGWIRRGNSLRGSMGSRSFYIT